MVSIPELILLQTLDRASQSIKVDELETYYTSNGLCTKEVK